MINFWFEKAVLVYEALLISLGFFCLVAEKLVKEQASVKSNPEGVVYFPTFCNIFLCLVRNFTEVSIVCIIHLHQLK